MPACVHTAAVAGNKSLVKRSEPRFLRFLIRKTVYIKTKCSNRTFFTSVQLNYYARIAFCATYIFRFCSLSNGSLFFCFLFFIREHFKGKGRFVNYISSHQAFISHFFKDFSNSGTCSHFSPPKLWILVKFPSIFNKFIHHFTTPLFQYFPLFTSETSLPFSSLITLFLEMSTSFFWCVAIMTVVPL